MKVDPFFSHFQLYINFVDICFHYFNCGFVYLCGCGGGGLFRVVVLCGYGIMG